MGFPAVAIVGRVNVGKSSLFNRIVGRRQAIVDDAPGVTRDRNLAMASWTGFDFLVIDTGGLVPGGEDPLQSAIEKQIQLAVAESDAVILVVDARAGLHPFDSFAADLVRRSGLPVFVAANKIDDISKADLAAEFYSLGLGDVWPVSAAHGTGTGDLLDQVVAVLPRMEEVPEDELQLAVVGRPNVGKSSLVNRLCGSERVIVTPRAGTTRDSTDELIIYEDRKIRLVDTAGLRRRSRKMDDVEFYSTVRAWRSIGRGDVALVLMDGSEYPSHQDLRIAGKAWDMGKALILCVNKVDLGIERELWLSSLHERFRPARFAPILFISALTGEGVDKVLPTAITLGERRSSSIPTSVVNRKLAEVVEKVQPPSPGGKPLKFFYSVQVAESPPMLLIFANRPHEVPENYRRYLENELRQVLDLEGVPLRIVYRRRRH